jgi:hypothetical protein
VRPSDCAELGIKSVRPPADNRAVILVLALVGVVVAVSLLAGLLAISVTVNAGFHAPFE